METAGTTRTSFASGTCRVRTERRLKAEDPRKGRGWIPAAVPRNKGFGPVRTAEMILTGRHQTPVVGEHAVGRGPGRPLPTIRPRKRRNPGGKEAPRRDPHDQDGIPLAG